MEHGNHRADLDQRPGRRFRPVLEIDGQPTHLLVDQIRGIDVDYVVGDPAHYLERAELAEVEHAVARYLGL